jgi:hypothetical protein
VKSSSFFLVATKLQSLAEHVSVFTRGFLVRSMMLMAVLSAFCFRAYAQERPYFVTYSHQMEEPGSLEIATNPVFGTQRGAGSFLANWTEFEYGAKAWWTTEFYLDGQTTNRDSTVFTGFRWENRFRPLFREQWINPVLYAEFEDINAADKTLLEVVGHDVEADHAIPNAESHREREREMEMKLILSSNHKGWNISENVIAEKKLSNAPWEFGYALGASRPLGLAARPGNCTFCAENFAAGAEIYGGLGDSDRFGFRDTSHYLAPLLSWDLPTGVTLRFSPSFGLNSNSHRFLFRFGISYEIPGFGRRVEQMFRGKKP